jgi:cyclic pyranopterin phosphate synthase
MDNDVRHIPLVALSVSSAHDSGEMPLPTVSHDVLPDTLGRPLRDLRISVTDRCNFRCVYCMPRDTFGRDHAFLPRNALLTFEEIERIARVFAAQGIRKIRITGGEPLLRKGIENLIERLARLPVEIALTTNGSLLAKKAKTLKDAGLHRVTVSLDAFDEDIFKRMNDADHSVAEVLHGIEVAAAAGLPIKINCVVKRGVNDNQILPLARHFRRSGHILRFIEYMDVGNSNGWRMDEVLPSAEVIALIDSEFPLAAIDPGYAGEVAQRWRYRDGGGEIGVVSSVTQAFCGSCTRLRLSTEGQLYTCLFAQQGYDLRPLLRSADEAALAQRLADIWRARADRYSALRTAATPTAPKIEMSYIGG